jgi:hypothetical protein
VWTAIFALALVLFYGQKLHISSQKIQNKRHVFIAFSFKAMGNTRKKPKKVYYSI